MDINAKCLEEPDLIFGGRGEEEDPRKGLEIYGPFHYSDEEYPSPLKIRVGIIGNREGIEATKKILELLKTNVPSNKTNKWLYLGYPGFSRDSKLNCDIETSSNYHEVISDDNEVNRIINIKNQNERIASGVNLYLSKIKELKNLDDPPDVIICTLPKEIEEYCGISERNYGAKRVVLTHAQKLQNELKTKNQRFLFEWGASVEVEEKETDKSFDFRNSLKGKVMEVGIPTQILRESIYRRVLENSETQTGQDIASFCWNFSTALYYKASGKPWRLAKLKMDTCYVGISFFKNKLNPSTEVQISMAQIFTHNGEGLVLRGSEVMRDKYSKETHLKDGQAEDLLSNAIGMYIAKSKRNPTRIVIHKESSFSDEEKKGFNKAIYRVGNVEKDFITIKSRGEMRFLRSGNYPVLRGTLIKFSNKRGLLYTSGYTPRIRTYPGPRLPNPLQVQVEGDSSMEEVCKEILGLTKLNWNTTSFSTYLPITLAFSKEVGKILSELPDVKTPQNHYRFYM